MPETHRLYLDQMLRLDVAVALRDEGHDVMRAFEVGQARSDDFEILQKAIADNICECYKSSFTVSTHLSITSI
jgi:predicted nuclease of predicted toxin-antitoxin system